MQKKKYFFAMETNISEFVLTYRSHVKEITARPVYKRTPAHLWIPLSKEFSTEQCVGDTYLYFTIVIIRNTVFFVDIYRV